jgi:hypothetical protein
MALARSKISFKRSSPFRVKIFFAAPQNRDASENIPRGLRCFDTYQQGNAGRCLGSVIFLSRAARSFLIQALQRNAN